VAPLLVRASGEIERLPATATMLGAFAQWNCREAAADLGRGDTLLLYSDGVTEAGIEHGEEFGEGRLAAILRQYSGAAASDLAGRVIEEVSRFGGASRTDDITVVALRGV
jgi:serine phosphatase RsbU (regulator of sigma subunit)